MKQSSKVINDGIFDIADALYSPVLTHAGSWASAIPKRIIQLVPIERLEYLIKGLNVGTDSECVAFIMTATFEAPMSGKWVDIYTHLCCKVCERYFNEDHWKTVSAPKELNEYNQRYLLEPLRRHIYNKRREILKKTEKERLKEKIEFKEVLNPHIPKVVEYTQLTLF